MVRRRGFSPRDLSLNALFAGTSFFGFFVSEGERTNGVRIVVRSGGIGLSVCICNIAHRCWRAVSQLEYSMPGLSFAFGRS